MDNISRNALQDSAVKLTVGFAGTILAFFLLPKTVKFIIRKFLLGVFSEVITVVLTGLLTERAVRQITKD